MTANFLGVKCPAPESSFLAIIVELKKQLPDFRVFLLRLGSYDAVKT